MASPRRERDFDVADRDTTKCCEALHRPQYLRPYPMFLSLSPQSQCSHGLDICPHLFVPSPPSLRSEPAIHVLRRSFRAFPTSRRHLQMGAVHPCCFSPSPSPSPPLLSYPIAGSAQVRNLFIWLTVRNTLQRATPRR